MEEEVKVADDATVTAEIPAEGQGQSTTSLNGSLQSNDPSQTPVVNTSTTVQNWEKEYKAASNNSARNKIRANLGSAGNTINKVGITTQFNNANKARIKKNTPAALTSTTPESTGSNTGPKPVNSSAPAASNVKTYVCGCVKPKNAGNSQRIVEAIQKLGGVSGGTRRKRNKHSKHNKNCKRNKSHKHSKHNKSCKKSKRSKRRKSMRNRR